MLVVFTKNKLERKKKAQKKSVWISTSVARVKNASTAAGLSKSLRSCMVVSVNEEEGDAEEDDESDDDEADEDDEEDAEDGEADAAAAGGTAP